MWQGRCELQRMQSHLIVTLSRVLAVVARLEDRPIQHTERSRVRFPVRVRVGGDRSMFLFLAP